MESTQTLQRAIDQTQKIVDAITAAQMTAPTPCTEFDVRTLLNHLVVSMQQFANAASGGSFDFGAYASDALGDDPPAAYRAASAQLRDAAGNGEDREWVMGAPMPAERGMAITVMEITQHGWDLAKATGQAGVFDEALCENVLDLARQNMPPDDQRPAGVFGSSVAIADDAPSSDRLAAFMGRTP